MRKTCQSCGERFEGNVCPKCGTRILTREDRRASMSRAADKFLTEEQRAAAEIIEKEKKKDRKNLIILLILALIAAVFIFYRNGMVGGGSYKKPIEQYFNAISQRDFNSYIDTMPYRMGEDYIAEREELGYSEYEYLNLLYADLFEQFGDDMTVSLEFFGRSRPEDEYIKSFESSYLRLYGETINTETVYGVSVAATFSGSVSTATVDLECYVLRQGGKWYMVGCDFAEE